MVNVPGAVPPAQQAERPHRTLFRATGTAGLLTLLLIFIPGVAMSREEPDFQGTAQQTVDFFKSLDNPLSALESFVFTLGIVTLLWFLLCWSALLRTVEPVPRWRSTVAAGSATVLVAVALAGTREAATLRSDDIDPQVARLAWVPQLKAVLGHVFG